MPRGEPSAWGRTVRPLLAAAAVLAACAGDPAPGDAPPSWGDVAAPAVEGLRFWDIAREAGLDVRREPVDGYTTVPDRMSGGVCVLDVDGEGPLDVFFAFRRGSDSRSRLYVAAEPFRYAEETFARALDDIGDAMGCLAADLDGDGDDDLLVPGVGGVRLFLRDGEGFVDASDRLEVAAGEGDVFLSAAAGDLTGDGRLDLVLSGYLRFRPEDIPADRVCPPSTCEAQPYAHPPLPNVLLVQQADGRFVDRTAELAPDLLVPYPTMAVAVTDVDRDGRPDVFTAQDLDEPNQVLLQQADGTFADRAEALGLDLDREGSGLCSMGWTSGDLDGDGGSDHVVTSFTRSATGVWMCPPEGRCEERADEVGTVALDHTFRWAPALADLDLDGDLDLLESTGHVFGPEELAIVPLGAWAQPVNLMLNDGAGHLAAFEPVPEDGLAAPRAARGVSVADLDDDGRLDVLLAPASGRPALLHNVTPPEGRWLRVVLDASAEGRTAVGARVTVTLPEGTRLERERRVGEGYLGNFDPRLHFGLGDAEVVHVEVRWPWGATTTVEDVATDRELRMTPPGTAAPR